MKKSSAYIRKNVGNAENRNWQEFSCAGVSPLDEPVDHSLYAYMTLIASEKTERFGQFVPKPLCSLRKEPMNEWNSEDFGMIQMAIILRVFIMIMIHDQLAIQLIKHGTPEH